MVMENKVSFLNVCEELLNQYSVENTGAPLFSETDSEVPKGPVGLALVQCRSQRVPSRRCGVDQAMDELVKLLQSQR